MKMTFRWFGQSDPVRLAYIRQIPGVEGIVGSLFDIPPGVAWTVEQVRALKDHIEGCGLRLVVIESIPVHEAIKMGRKDRDQYIEAYQHSIRVLGQLGIGVLCYNFMPVLDWVRTDLQTLLPDGSVVSSYIHEQVAHFDLERGMREMVAWANRFSPEELRAVMNAYREIDEEQLFQNLIYFLQAVAPTAQESGVKLALHPDDPPWAVFGLPRIVCDAPGLQRILDAVPLSANGLTFCTGALGALAKNDLPAMIRQFAGRIHFAHLRNIKRTAPQDFHEVAHPSHLGEVDMFEVVRALVEIGFEGPARPDHGRMIWGETGIPGYGLHDRALGAMYLQGLYEALYRGRKHTS